ncbi:MAG: hypothetical protein EXS17_04905 [Phycisphaerales bacterium]|nr:hypothetical protein [Phycisphaerales bacterium]
MTHFSNHLPGHLFGWIPILQPGGSLGNYWWLLLFPLVFGISIAYRATHETQLVGFWWRVVVFTVKSTIAMGSLGAAMYLFVYMIIPLLRVG